MSVLPDGTIAKVNRTFLAWTGFDPTLIVGVRRFQELLAVGDRIFYETHFGPALRMQGRVREIAVDIVTADRTRLPVLINAVLVNDEAGAPRLIRIAIFDARERRAYERELVAARHRAEESEARARTLAQVLQSTFLPPEIPAIPGLDVAGRYRPAGDGSEVGGDFYDVFDTGRGSWGIVLGDVAGKGAVAATMTAMARYTVRAEAARTVSPSQVLASVHDAALRHDPDRFCTAVLSFVEPRPGSHEVVVSCGGHHLPILLRGDGSTAKIGIVGSLLGMLDRVDLHDTTATLAPGDALVLVTDGVLEARSGSQFFGEDALLAVLQETNGQGAQEVADAVVDRVLDFQNGDARDDIAVVVLKA